MIDSPAQNVEDIHRLVKKTALARTRSGPKPPESEEVNQKVKNVIHSTTVTGIFLRLSYVNKLKFLTCLTNRVRSLGTITLLLNTLRPLTGKITYYCKSSNAPLIDFDCEILDHDRMLPSEPQTVKMIFQVELQWFETLNDQDQVGFLITLIRFSGGAVLSRLYGRIEAIHARRTRLREAPEDDNGSSTQEKDELTEMHDPKDPKHQKVQALTKEFDVTMAKLRKDVEGRTPKPEKEKKKMKRKREEDLDWIQLMPISIVKRVFTYLDKRSLAKAKKVNSYWKWAVGDFLADQKEEKRLRKAHLKLMAATGGGCTVPESARVSEPKPRVTYTEKRQRKLRQRGAILEELRRGDLPVEETGVLIIGALKRCGDVIPYIDGLSLFPRVKRTNAPLYKKPQYIVKDYKVICEESGSESDSENRRNELYFAQSMASESSDDF